MRLALLLLLSLPLAAQDRRVLPMVAPEPSPITTLDARTAQAPPRFEVKAPVGAPNVVIVLLDDFGFGQSSTFGGPVAMPTLDRLAHDGLRYNQFHTTALCSPTRMALKTGRNHHSCNTGAVMDTATAFPGDTGQLPENIAPLAEILRQNGFSTAAFGKWHETAPWEVSVSGPFDRWPTRQGFDKFYGFLGGETNQWAPMLYDGVTRVELPRNPQYHFTTDMTDQAIAWVRFQQALTPEKPFFLYYAPGATHAPHHVPKAWIDKYKGRFDGGWDRQRAETLAQQKHLGVVPANTVLAPKPAAIADWETLTPEQKRVMARGMEVFAGFASHADYEIGRLVSTLEQLHAMDNTLFLFVVGDNGASAEGGMEGVFNELTYFNGVQETLADKVKHLDDLGGPRAYNHYAAGWAVAGDAPFSWTKQVAADYGGTRNPLVVRWPRGIKAGGELRSQWHHVIDVAPTVLEACQLPQPKSVNGVVQRPMEGVSMLYSFADSQAPSRHVTQYFEIAGNRAIYHDGWLAGTVHRAPWELKPRRPLAEDHWELYNTANDFSLAHDLAAQFPDKLKSMQALFLEEALKYHVLPLDDRSIERLNPAIAGRPDLMGGRTELVLGPGMTGMSENVFLNIKNRSHSISAEVVTAGSGQGVIVCQGGRFGGWSLYLSQGRPCYSYNWLGLEQFTVTSPAALPKGKCTVTADFDYDGGGPGKGGLVRLSVNGREVARGRVERTEPNMFSPDETADVGVDEATNVTDAYPERDNRFDGTIESVRVQLL